MINAKDEFDLAGDGSDETTNLLTALNSGGDKLYFPPGVYGFSADLLQYMRTDFEGAGRDKTTFKNLSSTAMGLDWPNAGLMVNQSAKGFTIDQNGSAGTALTQKAQMSRLEDVLIKNQVGTNPAWYVEGATGAGATRIRIKQCDTGLKMLNVYYPVFNDIFLEAKRYRAFEIERCVSALFTGMYAECDETEATRPELGLIYGGSDIHFHGFRSEIPGPATLTPTGYFIIESANNVSFVGWRVKHYADMSSRSIFHLQNYCRGIQMQYGYWDESNQNMSLVTANNTFTKGVSVLQTVCSTPTGCYGVNLPSGISGVELAGWVNDSSVVAHNY